MTARFVGRKSWCFVGPELAQKPSILGQGEEDFPYPYVISTSEHPVPAQVEA